MTEMREARPLERTKEEEAEEKSALAPGAQLTAAIWISGEAWISEAKREGRAGGQSRAELNAEGAEKWETRSAGASRRLRPQRTRPYTL